MKYVIARYNEDISWADFLPNVVVYNKGDHIETDHELRQLPNVGREGHTFYTYMYENYNNLDDFTCFLQGYPMDHIQEDDQSATLEQKLAEARKQDYDWFNLNRYQNLIRIKDGCMWHKDLPFLPFLKQIKGVDIDPETHIVISFGGQFAVSRKAIHSNPREFYLRIVKSLETENNPMEGFCLERLHMYLFNVDMSRPHAKKAFLLT
jgi:hypothetical protein